MRLTDSVLLAIAAPAFCLLTQACQAGRPAGSAGMAEQPAVKPVQIPAVTQPVDAPVSLRFPLPRDLRPLQTTPRQTAYVPEDLQLEGNAFEPGLPNHNAAVGTGHADLNSTYAAGEPLGGCAFATFAFSIDGYDLNSEVRLGWATPPFNPANSYVGLANWDSNRWDWYRCDDSGRVFPASLNPYFDFGGDLLAVALLSGTEQAVLDYIRVGSVPPVAALTTSGQRFDYGILDAPLDASSSLDPDGTIELYEWDFDGDGTFDETSADDPLTSHQFTNPGSFNTTLRVTDDKGVTDTAILGFSVGGPWQRTLGQDGFDSFEDIAVAPDGSLWACGRLHDTSGFNLSDLLLVHFGADGTVLKTITWRGNNFTSQTGSCISVGDDGAVYVAGIGYTNTISHALFQRYSVAGELDWSVETPDFLIDLHEMVVANGSVVVVGSDNDGAKEHGVMFRMAATPFHSPSVCSRLPDGTELMDIVHFPGSDTEFQEFRLVGSMGLNGGDADLLYLALNTALDLISAQSWGAVGGTQLGRGLVVINDPLGSTTLVSSYRGTTPDIETCVLRLDNAKGYNIAGSDSVNVKAMWPSGLDSCYVLALESPFSTTPGKIRLLHLSKDLTFLDEHVWATQAPLAGFAGVPYGNGSFVIAGQAEVVGGTFESGSNVDIGPSATWTVRTPEITDFVAEYANAPGEFQQREAVLDTGGGNPDAMALMHKLETQ